MDNIDKNSILTENLIIDEIIKGEFSSNEVTQLIQISNQIIENIEAGPGIKNYNKRIEKCKKNIDRIKITKEFFEWIPPLQTHVELYNKNQNLSGLFREQGNHFYTKNQFELALRCYTLAITFAPASSPNLSLAFANRSAVFLALNIDNYGEKAKSNATDCLTDIEYSIEYGYPQKSRKKLLERKSKCEKYLEDLNKNKNHNELLEMTEKYRKFCSFYLFKIKGKQNLKIPSAEDFVELQLDNIKGRKLVLLRDIPPGTILSVEKPFAKVLKNQLKWETEHCDYCIKRIRGGIPCNNCTFVVYCSKECLEKAYVKFHRYECNCLKFLYLSKFPRYAQLACRIICSIGPIKFFEYFKNKTLENLPSELQVYNADDYFPIFNLVSHMNRKTPLEIFSSCVQTLFLNKLLEKYTNFFDEDELKFVDENEKEEFRDFISSIILHHLNNVPCNSFSLDEYKEFDPFGKIPSDDLVKVAEKIKKMKTEQFASATYVTHSLINHSCDCNAGRVINVSDGCMALISLKSIKSGSEIVTSYSRHFIQDEYKERILYLDNNYYFKCNCIPCLKKWPCLEQLDEKIHPLFICQNCFKNCNDEYSNFTLDNKAKCKKCKTTYQRAAIEEKFKQNSENFFKAYELILAKKPIEAFRVIVPCLDYIEKNINAPFDRNFFSQDMLRKCLELIVKFSE